MKEIKYLGKVLKTKHYEFLSKDECNKIRDWFYRKPTSDELYKEFNNIINTKGVKCTHINNMFFKDLMYKTKLYHSKWSVEEALSNDEILMYYYSKTIKNTKLFTDINVARNIEKAIQLGGKGISSVPTRFPIKAVRDVVSKYNVNSNYYDFSCGWGG